MYVCIYVYMYIYISIYIYMEFIHGHGDDYSCIYVCVHYLCHIDWVYVIYVKHVDRIDYMEPFSIL
jgi:hypothetical protein